MTIANSGHDENGKYHGGKAGDQTGNEWYVRSWYNRPWNFVARYPDAKIGEDIAYIATQGAKNNKIGYDQYERQTFWNQLQKVKDYDPKNIKVACEADCSAGVATCVKAVGYRKNIQKLKDVPVSMWTGIEEETLKKAGFKILKDAKYLINDAYLMPGDILCNSSHHTAINLTKGSKVSSTAAKPATTETKPVETKTSTTSVKYKVTAKSGLNCRKDAGTKYAVVDVYEYNQTITITETKKVNDISWGKTNKGWVCMTYVKKV